MDLDETLADGFDETDPRKERPEGLKQSQTRGRFSIVHPRGGNEQTLRGGIGRRLQ